jgi:hypothetical protein
MVSSILKSITIVRPETLVRWHRAGFRRYWRWKSRSLGGRPHIDAASARVNVSVFYQPLTPPTGLGLLTSLRGGVPGRAARGSTPER